MVKIVLDASAMRELFPKGSPAEVELAHAALHNVTKEYVKAISKTDLEAFVKSEATRIVRDELKSKDISADICTYLESSLGMQKWNYKFRSALVNEVHARAKEHLDDLVLKTINAEITKLKDSIVEYVSANFDLIVTPRIQQYQRTVLLNAIECKFNDALTSFKSDLKNQ